MKDSILSINNLHKNYASIEVLKDINVSMVVGDFLVLVGPSGCGKSTLLNCIAGLDEVTSGSIRIANRDMTNVPPKDRDIAMVFQSYALYPTMSVGKNITFGLRVRGIDAATQKKKLNEVAKLLQIEPLLARKPAQLSGGQRQRVAMGRALVRAPQLFLFDEPLSNLDAKLRVEMRTEIKKLHQTLGTSIVYVTHDQIEAMTLATKIVVMKEGVIQQIGTPSQIYNQPANLFVAIFMGSPQMNLIPAKIHAADNASTQIEINHSPHGKLVFPTDATIAGLNAGETRSITIGIRPEDITNPSAHIGKTAQIIECTVELVEPTGADIYAVMRLGETEIIARVRADTDIAAGKNMAFAFDFSKASYFDATSGARLN